MRLFRNCIALIASVFIVNLAFANPNDDIGVVRRGFKGEISFTPEEVAAHQASLPALLEKSSGCLRAALKHHQTFFAKYGISPYYGSLSAFSKLTQVQRAQHLRQLGVSPRLLDHLQPTSCIGLTMQCLEEGFTATGTLSIWKKLKTFTSANDADGSALQAALRLLGWRVLYWNPNVAYNEYWDQAEMARDPSNTGHFWGWHAERWKSVTGPKRNYYYNSVDDSRTLVNFGTNPPPSFAKIPFFVGTAHTGYHVFPGMFGQVIEGHSMRALSDSQTIENSKFNPLQNGGGPRGDFKSGLIAIPPGY